MMRVLQSMLGLIMSAAVVAAAIGADSPPPVAAANPHPKVAIETSEGNIVVELDRTKAPASVANFLMYVAEGHYNGTIFHRVIDGFMIQGGGYSEDFQRKPTHDPVRNESNNGLKNTAGTIAMARTRDPESATAQFFINVADNDFLDSPAGSPTGTGYTVFGHVIAGMDTVQKILALPTGHGGPFPKDVPQTTVLINRVTLISSQPDNDSNPPPPPAKTDSTTAAPAVKDQPPSTGNTDKP